MRRIRDSKASEATAVTASYQILKQSTPSHIKGNANLVPQAVISFSLSVLRCVCVYVLSSHGPFDCTSERESVMKIGDSMSVLFTSIALTNDWVTQTGINGDMRSSKVFSFLNSPAGHVTWRAESEKDLEGEYGPSCVTLVTGSVDVNENSCGEFVHIYINVCTSE